MTTWHNLGTAEILHQLGTDSTFGLSDTEVRERLAKHGPNELVERGIKSPWLILWEQLTAIMVAILILAAIISAFLGDYKDAIAIMAIVILNAILGFNQEYRAEKAIAALKKLAVPTVRVRRNGHVLEISARNLVPGDIILLEAGNLVPADGRLLTSVNLRTQEATLTGESAPVDKEAVVLAEANLPLGDRQNMIYMGTVISYGRGQAIVTETGMKTELGRIAQMIQTVQREPTPLQQRLHQLGKGLAIAALALVGIIFGIGLLDGENIRLLFLTAVSLAVAAVPEGLPAVVTIALALGSQRMLKRQALIRKLPAVETLGSVTVICSDKTGTLTENCMTVTVLDVAGSQIELDDSPAEHNTSFSELRNQLNQKPALSLLLTAGALCNDALLEIEDKRSGDLRIVGDPTEGALVAVAARLGLEKSTLEQVLPRVAELPFDSERKRMTTIHQLPSNLSHLSDKLPGAWNWNGNFDETPYIAFTKGAVDSLLTVSTQIWINDQTEPLSESWRERIVAANDKLAQKGMRVLGLAFLPLESLPANNGGDNPEKNLIFLGLTGMLDPARPEVKAAMQTCKTAGIRPVMITGDQPLTARHIAQELGMTINNGILTGQDLSRMSAQDFRNAIDSVSVYARVSPENKLDIVQALQDQGHIVAMTGDGVNDAPALKKADIGVAMGITGTDVSKEAADMVLQDDNFATIVAAVEEGRIIYDNIRRFVKYLLSCNSGEIWVMMFGPLLGMPLPLLPLQILWMNLVTDGLPALALGVEPAERNIMHRPPYPPNENFFARGMARDIIWVGIVMGLVSLGLGYGYWNASQTTWQTVVFTTLTLSQMAIALGLRSERDSLFTIGLLSNRTLLGAVTLTFILQLGVIYLPVMQSLLKTVALGLDDLIICLMFSTLAFWSIEIKKWLVRRTTKLDMQGDAAKHQYSGV